MPRQSKKVLSGSISSLRISLKIERLKYNNYNNIIKNCGVIMIIIKIRMPN